MRGMSKKIYIFTSFIGFGHCQVARAVEQGLKQLYGDNAHISTLNFFSLVSPEIEEFLSRQYFHWIKEKGVIWKYLYDPFSGKINVSDLMNMKGRLFVSFINMVLHFIFKKESMQQLESYLENEYSGKIYISEKEFLAFLSGELFETSSDKSEDENIKFTGYFDLFYRLVNFGFERLSYFFEHNEVDGVVATQVYPSYFSSYLKARFNFPLCAVITDYHVHSYWISPEVDRYFVPQKEQAEYLVDKGVAGNKIYDYGIPVTADFLKDVDRRDLCRELAIDPQKKIILIMGGGLGIGVEKLLEIFLFSLEREYQEYFFIFICGNDTETYEKLQSIQETFRTNIKVLGQRDDIYRFMKSAALLITKPGGVTITEAMNCHLPMILIPVIKGQEEENIDFFVRKKLALTVNDSDGAGPLLRYVLHSREYSLIKERLKLYAKTTAAIDTAREIGKVAGLTEV